MSASPNSHYAVLGIEKTADERAIKSAYFKLVRQFPPETHPEEFQKLRAAYEVLSDPEKRRAYDAATNFNAYEDETGGKLTAARHAIDADEWERAIGILEPLIEERPELHVAYDLLGLAYIHVDRTSDARRVLQKAISLCATEGSYHLHFAYALHGAGNKHAAIDECRQAVELDLKLLDAYWMLIKCAEETEQPQVAVKAIDVALQHAARNIFDIFDLTLRKIRIDWKGLGPKGVLAAVDALLAKVPADADIDTRKHLVTKLSNLSAVSFARSSVNLGNAILGRCHKLRGTETTQAPIPKRIEVEIGALPTARQEFLRRVPNDAELSTKPQSVRTKILGRAAGAFAALLVILSIMRNVRGVWSTPQMAFSFLCLAAALVAVTFTFRDAWRYFRSEFDEFRFAHGLYFFHVQGDRLVAWPLFTLDRSYLTDHQQNGSYSHTSLVISFGKDQHTVRFQDATSAQQWAGSLDYMRRTALEMLATGLIEEDPDAQFFSRENLESARKAKEKSRLDRQTMGWAAGAVTLAGVAVLLFASTSRGPIEEATFLKAMRSPNLDALAKYLATKPPARFAAVVEKERTRRFVEADERCRLRMLPLPGASPMLCSLIEQLETNPGPLRVVTTLDTKALEAQVRPSDELRKSLEGATRDLSNSWVNFFDSSLFILTGDRVTEVMDGDAGKASQITVQCAVLPPTNVVASAQFPPVASLRCEVRTSIGRLTDAFTVTGETAPDATPAAVRRVSDYPAALRTLEAPMMAKATMHVGLAAEGHPTVKALVTDPPASTSPYAAGR